MRRFLSMLACCAVVSAIVYVAWVDPMPLPQKTGRYALPLLIGDGFLLAALSLLLAAPGWNRLGLALWILAVSAAGGLVVFGMPHAALGPPWQGPALIVGLALFAVAAEHTRKRLAGER